jgi:hypothetical protein
VSFGALTDLLALRFGEADPEDDRAGALRCGERLQGGTLLSP